MDEDILKEIIERLRQSMIEEANKEGSLTNQNVVKLSQQLDKYIVMLQKTRKNKAGYVKVKAATYAI